MDNFNEIYAKTIQWELKFFNKKQRIPIKKAIYHAHESEDETLLKCQFSLIQSIVNISPNKSQ